MKGGVQPASGKKGNVGVKHTKRILWAHKKKNPTGEQEVLSGAKSWVTGALRKADLGKKKLLKVKIKKQQGGLILNAHG